MRILGVDPGTHRTGTGLIESSGGGAQYTLVHAEVITLNSKHPLPSRLYQIFQKISSLISDYQPSVLALENVFFGRDLTAMVKIGEARACAMLAASKHRIEVVEYAPARIKQAVSGNGRATKAQMQYMIKQLLNLKSVPPTDAADALAIAVCHLHSSKNPKTARISSWRSPQALKAFHARIAAET